MAYSAHWYPFASSVLTVAGGSVNATFLYDAEGSRVKGTPLWRA